MTTPRPPIDLTLPDARAGDARRDAPTFHRNGTPIVDALRPRLADAAGDALEVGSGSGQHVALLAHAFPGLVWRPSDPDPVNRASIDAWRAHIGLETVRPAIDLDASADDWPPEAAAPAPGFRVVFSANVVHIAPWAVAEGLFRGAARRLAPDGFLALYGPFRWHGRHIAASNEAFDGQLRARDAAWGVRDVDDLDALAKSCALARADAVAMPANNHILFFERMA